jgi:hypothetical protein
VADTEGTLLAVLETTLSTKSVAVRSVVAHTFEDLITLRRFLQQFRRVMGSPPITVDRAALHVDLGPETQCRPTLCRCRASAFPPTTLSARCSNESFDVVVQIPHEPHFFPPHAGLAECGIVLIAVRQAMPRVRCFQIKRHGSSLTD